MTPFTAVSGITAANNVAINSGYCQIMKSGRYQFLISSEADSYNGSDPIYGMVSGMLFYNQGWRLLGPGWTSTGGSTYIKETYGGAGCILDCVAGDLINLAMQQTNPGALTYALNYSIVLMVTMVR